MIGSRGLTFIRFTNQIAKNYLLQNGRQNFQKQITRSSHDDEVMYYRKAPEPHRKSAKMAQVLGAIVWWWLVWHFLTDYHEVFGGSPYPDMSSLTDEELGIPPDTED